MKKEFIIKIEIYSGMPKGGFDSNASGGMVYRQEEVKIVKATSAKEAINQLKDKFPYFITIIDMKQVN